MSSKQNFPVPQSILKALALPLDPSKSSFSSRGFGAGFAKAGRIRALVPSKDGQQEVENNFFIKTSPHGENAKEMFRGEFASLNAIADAVPELCPRALAWGKLEDENEEEEVEEARSDVRTAWFLVTEFLDLSGYGRKVGTSLARRLGKLHSTPAPAAPSSLSSDVVNLREGKGDDNDDDDDDGGGGRPQFGFPVPTFCGDVKQPNEFRRSWADFFAEQRLMTVLAECEKRNGKDKELRGLVERTAAEVVPNLLGDGHLGFDKSGNGQGITPVVVHGDLWSGNASKGTIMRSSSSTAFENDDEAGVGDVVYDPSACYAHSEFELGIMQMFGGFGADFYREYHRIVPKTEPADEYADRVLLYELYHQLNHTTIFGGSYRSSAVGTMQKLLRKYGNK
ncbi:hypothetical protein AJ80_05526 [Polytolypa hystricis UAMH7299]|uniref:protein-ribulosamine 3-kinase n=1 Tax=Polytolypa hystricis (strain UAMH7299) TaxID=1447883 RepID=A0A2B7Y2Z3_POLH7|nr:hypothetical protein AJ80_05526 [Polytolypa hystricis UAMH7299]